MAELNRVNKGRKIYYLAFYKKVADSLSALFYVFVIVCLHGSIVSHCGTHHNLRICSGEDPSFWSLQRALPCTFLCRSLGKKKNVS